MLTPLPKSNFSAHMKNNILSIILLSVVLTRIYWKRFDIKNHQLAKGSIYGYNTFYCMFLKNSKLITYSFYENRTQVNL